MAALRKTSTPTTMTVDGRRSSFQSFNASSRALTRLLAACPSQATGQSSQSAAAEVSLPSPSLRAEWPPLPRFPPPPRRGPPPLRADTRLSTRDVSTAELDRSELIIRPCARRRRAAASAARSHSGGAQAAAAPGSRQARARGRRLVRLPPSPRPHRLAPVPPRPEQVSQRPRRRRQPHRRRRVRPGKRQPRRPFPVEVRGGREREVVEQRPGEGRGGSAGAAGAQAQAAPRRLPAGSASDGIESAKRSAGAAPGSLRARICARSGGST